MAEQVRRVASAVQSLDQMTRSRSPSDTIEAHSLKVAEAAKKMQRSVDQARGHFNAALTEGLRDLYTQISSRTGIDGADTPRGAEIRAYFRGLSAQERVEALGAAANGGDRETLTAIYSGPAYLSGIHGEARDRFLEFYQQKVAPELVEELELLKQTDEAAQTLIGVAKSAAESAFDPAIVERALQAQARADSANAAFAETTIGAA